MESNQRLRGQSPASLPAATTPQSICSHGKTTLIPLRRKPRDSNPQSRFLETPAFQTGSSTIRMTSVRQVAGAGIEPADSWFKATNFYQQKLPRTVTKKWSSIRRGRGSRRAASSMRVPTSLFPYFCFARISPTTKCSAGVEPACSAWKADTFAARPRAQNSPRRKPRDSNPQSRFLETPAFETGSSSGRMTSVRQAAVAGLEPALDSLTVSCLAIWPHRTNDPITRTPKHPAGVEPAPPPWQDGRLPLHHGCD